MSTRSTLIITCLGLAAVLVAAGACRSKPTDEAPMTQPAQRVLSKSGHDITPLTAKQVDELAAGLTTAERDVILAKGTERAFCGNLVDNHLEGFYACRLCGLPLFASKAKFDSGTGWPSFFQPVDPQHVKEHRDTSYGMIRTEITCARCGGHLGHVFDDGPPPTGRRFCLNSVSLTFYGEGAAIPEASKPVAK